MMSELQNVKNRPLEGLWTVPLVKDWLNAKTWKFEKNPWSTWLVQHGGPEAVLDFIRSRPIPPPFQELLTEILAHPGENRDYYAAKLNIHPVTVSNYFTKLARLLATYLNQWSSELLPPALSAYQQRQTSLSNLPSPLNTFIGREQEIITIRNLLRQPGVRLVTLIGPGGVGKTRLALQVASEMLREFPDGVFFVALASITNPQVVFSTILQTLGLKEIGEQSAQEILGKQLRNMQLLLVLDNFEQVLPCVPQIADLLSHAAGLKMLVTSRTMLHISGEQVFVVPPLALPPIERDEGERMTDAAVQSITLQYPSSLILYPSVELFVARARAVAPDLTLTEKNAQAVAAVCTRLDGLPLAIELAAARSRMFAPPALLARLDKRLELLTGGAHDLPARQRSLRDTIDWSYLLLTPAEQAFFRHLAVFVGGCTLEAAEAIASALSSEHSLLDAQYLAIDVLESLFDNSLLSQHIGRDGEPRFVMLDTIREYALEQLAACSEQPIYQQAHATYYLALVERAEPELTSDESIAWLNRLEQEYDNIRAALHWAFDRRHWEISLRMSGAMWEFWYARGYFREGRQWLAQALQGVSFVSDEVSVGAIYAEGILATAQGDYDNAKANIERAREIYQALGKKADLARAIHALGYVAWNERNYDRATEFYTQALGIFQELNDLRRIGDVTHNLGMIAFDKKDYKTARQYLEKSLAIARSPLHIALTLIALGSTAYWQKDYAEAVRLYNESVDINQRLGDQDCLVLILESFGCVAHDLNDFETAAHVFGAAEKLRDRLGLPADTPVHDIQKQMIAEARNQYTTQWETWWSAGQAMMAAHVIEFARKRLQMILQTEEYPS
jgi:predicted ATPase